MEKVLAERLNSSILLYIDDILIFSKTWEEHKEHVRWVLKKLKEHNLVVSKKKCKWVQEKIEFLGLMLTKNGVNISQVKEQAIRDLVPPTSVKEVQSMLGFLGVFRRFIPNYAKVAAPLNTLLKKDAVFKWGKEEQEAWQLLKDRAMKAPTLGIPEMEGKFELHTDACVDGYGAVLLQEREIDEEKSQVPICCISRSTRKEEKRYDTGKLEAEAIVWAMDKLQCYLHGHHVTVVTDHNGLQYYEKHKESNGKAFRSLDKIRHIDFDIVYKPGETNIADYISWKCPENARIVAVVNKSRQEWTYEWLCFGN